MPDVFPMPHAPLRGKAGRYQRIVWQLEELLAKPGDHLSRMATIAAVLHHKFPDFFWTGFYLLRDPLVQDEERSAQEEEAGADPGAGSDEGGTGAERDLEEEAGGAESGAGMSEGSRSGEERYLDEIVKREPKQGAERDLVVGPYQGPVACQLLARHTGVCWAAIDRGETVVVPNVHEFPGHIACDARSNSEIVVPLRRPSHLEVDMEGQARGEARGDTRKGAGGNAGSEAGSDIDHSADKIVGVLDIDSEKLGTFDEVDAEWLERIVGMVYSPPAQAN